MTGKVLGRMLEMAGIKFVYYYGIISPSQRQKAIKTFKENDECKILVSFIFQRIWTSRA